MLVKFTDGTHELAVESNNVMCVQQLHGMVNDKDEPVAASQIVMVSRTTLNVHSTVDEVIAKLKGTSSRRLTEDTLVGGPPLPTPPPFEEMRNLVTVLDDVVKRVPEMSDKLDELVTKTAKLESDMKSVQHVLSQNGMYGSLA